MLCRFVVTFGLALLVSVNVFAETENTSTFTAFFENDLFGDTDQNYTNGIKLSWVSPDLKKFAHDKRVPKELLPYVRRVLFFDRSEELDSDAERNVVFSLGQSIFTPRDITRFDLIEDDRPYGGWLYLGLAFRKRDQNRLDTLEFQAGVVGPFSLAEHAQSFVHDLRGLSTPNGWSHQLENEPVVGLAYERKWRVMPISGPARFGFDVVPHVGASLGNAFIFANVGTEVRLGWNLPGDFGDPIIRSGGVTSPPSVLRRSPGWRWYIFGYADLRATARDIFLDGNTFADGHSVEKETFVTDLAFGASFVFDGFKITATQVLRTREFDRQLDEHRFGSISLSYSY